MKTTAPLSKSQYGIYAECVGHENEVYYNLPYLYVLDGSLDAERLCRAIETMLKAHPTLFTRIGVDDEGEPFQTIDMDHEEEFGLSVERVTDLEAEKQRFVEPFQLYGGRLFHTKVMCDAEHIYWFFDAHHIIFDGVSIDIMLHDVEVAYGGSILALEDMTQQELALAEAEKRNTPAFEEDKEWYAKNFDCGDCYTPLLPDLELQGKAEASLTRTLNVGMDRVEQFCKDNGIYRSNFFMAAYAFLLAKYAGEQQSLFATISNGRTDERFERSVGMSVKTLPVYAQFTDESTVLDFLKACQDQMDGCRQHSTYAYTDLKTDLNLQIGSSFVWHGTLFDKTQMMGKPMETIKLRNFTLGVPLCVIAYIYGHQYQLTAEYNSNEYSEALISQFMESYEAVLEGFLTTANLRDISITTASQVELLDSFNQNDVSYDDTQTIVSLFRRQVELHPDNIAMVYHDLRLTYKQVDEQSERIAQYVQSLGLGNEDVVSILIPRSEWMVLASLGVLKAGCAYQPLDPSYPAERLNFMMRDAGAKLLIADEELRPIVDEYQGQVLLTKDIETLPAATQPVKADITPSSLFILLYTSGSTGTPKGCQLEHGNLVCLCHWCHRYWDMKPEHKVAAYASFGFDVCMMDLYATLTCGAAVYIIGDDIRLNLPDLNDYFEREGITHSFMTTQVGCQFAINFDNHSLINLSVGGEKVLPLIPPTDYQFHNGYGPTECTVLATIYPMHEYEQNVPIGKPLDNLRLYVVGSQSYRLPLGAVGELWISGPQVSRGYLNRPEKTAEAYLTNPFTTDAKYSRVYRTGDIVRYLADGNIQFVGRRDGQVKIRGFRIELKEVEAVIREYPGIKDATVQAFDYETGGKYIAAYIVSDEQVDIKELNDFIGKRKPPYMIPAATMQIDSIPLNQNQKVNRKALPAPVIQAANQEYVEPKNEMERMFADIFADILSLDKVSATDNFFELGGSSLMVTKVIIECDKAGYHVIYGDVFTHPTPRSLAQFVSGEAPEEESDVEFTNFDYTGIDALLQHNNIGTFLKGERQKLGHVLLTGATGYLGIHVLRELIDSDAETITCLVRGKDQLAAEHRLKNLLYYYFENPYKELFGSRLFVVNGDVTQEINVDRHIDTVFNCAANVKHFSKGTDIEDVNIGGAQRCVEFCLKTGARLVHISTTSVGEIWIIHNEGERVPMLDERKLWFGQFLDNRYISSKFLAERAVLDAVAHHGLSAKVMRVGNLAPRSYDGEFQANFNSNSFMGRLKVFYLLGCCTFDSYDEPTEMSPIDQTAKAVVLLASTPKECTVFQPFNNHTELLGDILERMAKVGKKMRFVEDDEFGQILAVAGQDPKKAKLLSAMMAYQDMTHGQKACIIERDNRYTCSVLHRLGFQWAETSWDYVERMLNAIGGFGFFDE